MKNHVLALLSALAAIPAAPLAADPVADFYRGKQMQFIIRTPPGGDYDSYSRLLARHMGRHIPGNPTITPVNMPGGGGIIAANHVGQVAPKDGTVLTMVSQGLPIDQALQLSPSLRVDLRSFNWIGNLVNANQLLVVWHTSKVRTLEQAKTTETLIGSTGAGSVSVQLPAFYNNVLGTRFKIIMGYAGGQEVDLAMERGEVDGRGTNTYTGYQTSKPQYLANKLIIPLIQVGMARETDLPDTPLLLEQQVQPQDRPLLEFMSKAITVGRPVATTPGVPAERVAALRKAFMDTLEDPDFMAEAKQQNAEVRPMTGEVLQATIRDLIEAPQAVRDRVKVALQPKASDTLETAPKR
jgi:tripartite-type tricarboxylate transporter receptor subunit TctC